MVLRTAAWLLSLLGFALVMVGCGLYLRRVRRSVCCDVSQTPVLTVAAGVVAMIVGATGSVLL